MALVALGSLVARGAAPLCVAGVALGDIHLRFTWQAWRLEAFTCVWRGGRGGRGACCTWWRAWSPLVARGAAPLCVAGVALGDIHLRFTWQAWHLETFTCVWRGRRGACCTWWRAWSPLVPRAALLRCWWPAVRRKPLNNSWGGEASANPMLFSMVHHTNSTPRLWAFVGICVSRVSGLRQGRPYNRDPSEKSSRTEP